MNNYCNNGISATGLEDGMEREWQKWLEYLPLWLGGTEGRGLPAAQVARLRAIFASARSRLVTAAANWEAGNRGVVGFPVFTRAQWMEIYDILANKPRAELAMTEHYPANLIVVPESEEWVMPGGAFKRLGGPT